MKTLVRRLWEEDDGQDLIEYALLAAFISLVSLAAIQFIGQGINAVFGKIDTELKKVP